jgi:hypothetical protein
MKIKPIETEYRGYKFRSRLEARWAVFFDEIGLTWEYEKEGYNLDGTYYLPDFWIWQWDCFIEIKGDPAQLADGLDKLNKLSKMTGKLSFLLYGTPDHEVYQMIFPENLDSTFGHVGIDNPNKILQCRRCDGFWYAHIEWWGWGSLGDCKNGCDSEKSPWLSELLLNAHNKAKSYRF